MATTIQSPVKKYTGRFHVGPVSLDFQNGKATHDGELPDGVTAYLETNGYGINSDPSNPASPPNIADPHDLSTARFGTSLRDAAVDPKNTDYLAPINAGEANPYGPDVVSPEIHGSQGVRPVKPGDVGNPDVQEDKEPTHAEQIQGAVPEAPAGNASTEDWRTYAVARGIDEGSLEDLNRKDIQTLIENLDK